MGYRDANCAGMYQRDNANLTTCAIKDTWYQVENFSLGSVNKWTFASNTLTSPAIGGAADYVIIYSVSAKCAVKDNAFEFAIEINGVIQDISLCKRYIKTVDQEASYSGVACIRILDAQTLKLMVRNRTNTDSLTIVHSSVVVHRI